MNIEPNDLLLFARVADAHSFSRAAEQLGLPKSTVSRRVAGLEAQLGERLLLRTTRKLTLTDFGHTVLEHAQQIVAEVDAASSLAQHRQAEVQAADVLVLGVPMYNFGVPAQLKNWIDAIARARVTFTYTDKGPVGLLTGKKVYVALTRGGQYRNTPADTQVPYLKTVLAFLGMTDVQFVYAEGLAMGAQAEQDALASAHAQIDELGIGEAALA